MSLSKSESDTLNLIRWISTAAIVVCHILQGYDHTLAWVFNIGVQVFFILSGFLYGIKTIPNVKNFYRGRIVKLYLPSLIWIFFAVVVLFLFTDTHIGLKDLVLQVFFIKNIPGLGHLWFMYVLFICYLVLPLIERTFSGNPKLRPLYGIASTVIILLLARNVATCIWVSLYFLGYLCGRFRALPKYLLPVSFIISLVILWKENFSWMFFRADNLENYILHAALGMVIFTGLYLLGRQIRYHNRVSNLLQNGGGYEVYLTHHLFIIGPLSLLFITEYPLLNLLIIFSATAVSSFSLNKISKRLRYK